MVSRRIPRVKSFCEILATFLTRFALVRFKIYNLLAFTWLANFILIIKTPYYISQLGFRLDLKILLLFCVQDQVVFGVDTYLDSGSSPINELLYDRSVAISTNGHYLKTFIRKNSARLIQIALFEKGEEHGGADL